MLVQTPSSASGCSAATTTSKSILPPARPWTEQPRCHPRIAARQALTHHARTLSETGAAGLRAALPAAVWLPDPDLPVAYRVTERNGALGVEAQAREYADGRDYVLRCYYDPGRRAPGAYTETIRLSTTDPAYETITVRAMIVVAGRAR